MGPPTPRQAHRGDHGALRDWAPHFAERWRAEETATPAPERWARTVVFIQSVLAERYNVGVEPTARDRTAVIEDGPQVRSTLDLTRFRGRPTRPNFGAEVSHGIDRAAGDIATALARGEVSVNARQAAAFRMVDTTGIATPSA